MKRVFALLLALVVVFSLTACKSKEQRDADKYVKKMNSLVEDLGKAVEKNDKSNVEEIADELNKLTENYQDIYTALEESDPEAAQELQESIIEIGKKYTEVLNKYVNNQN